MEITHEQITDARKLLKKAGYFTDNLWHINDVLFHDGCPNGISNDDAYRILRNALQNEELISDIFHTITYQLEEQNGRSRKR